MRPHKLLAVAWLCLLLLAGAWLLSRPAQLQPETVARQKAVQRAIVPLAPAGAAPGTAVALELDEPAVVTLEAVEPVSVAMSDVPAGVYDPNNQYDRWLRGEIDLESESIVSQVELEVMRQASLDLPPVSEELLGLQTTLQLAALNSGVTFAGIDITQCCGGGANVPPDPELAVGRNHVILVVNVAFAVYSKNGTVVKAPTTFASLFQSVPGCTGTGLFDPNVLYDDASDRYMMAVDANGQYYCVAVSQSGDPLGSWNLYRFIMNSGGYFFDYPHAGVGRDAIYVGGNMFSGSQFSHSRVWALPKWSMYNNQPAAAVQRSLPIQQYSTPQPLKLHGAVQGDWPASGPHYILVEKGFDAENHTLFAWNAPFTANTFSLIGSFNLVTATGVPAGLPVNVPQDGAGLLQANDFRPLDFEYRNGYGWTTMTIACNPGGGTVNCVRWAQINLANAAVVQAGVLASNGDYRFFPDLAVNDCNDMVLGYSKSSASMFPATWVAGRSSSDPPGTLQTEMPLKAGEIAYTAFDPSPRRWGDYTGMTIDPDGKTFWYAGQYSKITGSISGRWGIYIRAFEFDNCAPRTLDNQIYLPLIVNSDEPAPPPPPPPPPAAIVNGDFESGPVGWLEYSLQGWDLILPSSVLPPGLLPRSGNWLAWLGGDDNEVAFIQQQVAVSSANPYLAYWYWSASQDSCGQDWAQVRVNNVAVHGHQLCTATNSGGWVPQVLSLEGYAGQTVTLEFRAETNAALNSNFFLDDVAFQVSATAPLADGPMPAVTLEEATVLKDFRR